FGHDGLGNDKIVLS
ncbi:hypothetical protein A2U01_0119017, partial [Trifolium medium]|nr:hypothetical protein [Trifolium medium]